MESAHGRQPGKGSELLDFVKGFASKNTLTVEEDLGHGFVRLRVTEAERRQARQDIRYVEDVVVEMARNSRDAGSRRIYIASRKEKGRWRHLAVLDEGSGIPEAVRERIFESRVTSKVDEVLTDSRGVHGRGMALFSIRRAVEAIELFRTAEGQGSIFKVLVDLRRLPERRDQSTWPALSLEEGRLKATGPHNVLRSLVDLAFDADAPAIYLGSNSEVLATLFAHARDRARRGGGPAPLWQDLHGIREGRELALYASGSLGLEVSERSAFRVLEEEILPLSPLQELALRKSGLAAPAAPGAVPADRRAPLAGEPLSRRFSRPELDGLAAEVLGAAERLGSRYFLKPGACRVRRSGNRLVISVSFDED